MGVKELPQSVGGRATAKILRQKALDNYYTNPNKCKHCGKVIEVPEGRKVSCVRTKKFCDKSCAATYNNRKFPRWGSGRERKRLFCSVCGLELFWEGTIRTRKKLCVKCKPVIGRKPKKDVTHSEIRGDARRKYFKYHKEPKCEYCGYDNYIEVAHKTPVRDFSPETVVSVINDFCNLVGLCRNHHWELDHGYLKI